MHRTTINRSINLPLATTNTRISKAQKNSNRHQTEQTNPQINKQKQKKRKKASKPTATHGGGSRP